MAELQADARQNGIESTVVVKPFDLALQDLRDSNYDMISTEQNADLRRQEGKKSHISQNGNYVKEGIIYIPNGKPRLVRVSPILSFAKESTEAHRQGVEFYPAQSSIDIALDDSVEFPQKNIEIPTNRFGSEELLAFLFGGVKKAQAYGNFLDYAGIKAMPVWAVDKSYVKNQSNSFARQLWFGGLGDSGSDLIGDCRNLIIGGSVRGVRSVVSTLGANEAQKISQPESELYSPEQIVNALEGLQLQGLEAQLFKALRTK